jgi:hypothetical protein
MKVHSPIPRFDRLPGLNSPVGAKIMVLIARLLLSLKWMPAVSGEKATSPRPAFDLLSLGEMPLFTWGDPVEPTQLTTPRNEEDRLTLFVSVL